MKIRPNGQTLVLFALTLLLMTLLVLMTLSFGSKVKSRMEVQTVADATAYSNAVSTARSMNAISVMNRVNVAHAVSTLGTLSLISWVTLFYVHAKNAATLWFMEFIMMALGAAIWCAICSACSVGCAAVCGYCASCKWGMAQTGGAAFLSFINSNIVLGKLKSDVKLFNTQTRPRWFASLSIFADQGAMYGSLLSKQTTAAGSFAATYATQGNLPGVTALPAPGGLNTTELTTAMAPGQVGPGAQPYHASMIINASRGHKFVPWRKGVGGGFLGPWSMKLTLPWSLPAGIAFTDNDDEGRGYVNDNPVNFASGMSYGHPGGSWAQDVGDKTRVLLVKPTQSTCKIFGFLALAVGLIGKGASAGLATVGPFMHPAAGHNVQHAYAETFPPFYDFNPGNPSGIFDRDDIYAAPKNMSMVSANPLARNDPWESRGQASGKAVNLKFTPGATGFDMTTEPASKTNGMQNAVGSGVTYYSRPDHYEEPPNLFAPFWRAGLSRMTVDRPGAGPGRGPYDAALKGMFAGSGQTEAGVTFQELVSSGYKGFE